MPLDADTDSAPPMPGAFPTAHLPLVEDNSVEGPTVDVQDFENASGVQAIEHPDASDSLSSGVRHSTQTSTSGQPPSGQDGDLFELGFLLDELIEQVRTLITSITPPRGVEDTSSDNSEGNMPQNDDTPEDVEMSDA